jgi:AraC-like DNA-binding protein
MSLVLAHTNGELLPLRPGLPAGFAGGVLHGTNASHIQGEFGQLTVQEYHTELVSIRKVDVAWKRPEKLVCRYHYSPGIFSRVMLHATVHEYLKGAGDLHLHRDEFGALAGSNWYGLIIGGKAGECQFFDMHWSRAFVQAVTSDERLTQMLLNISNGVPDRLTGAAHGVDPEMRALLANVQHLDYSASKARDTLHRVMRKYLFLLLKEMKEQRSLKAKMRTADWECIHEARRLIENENTHLSTPELAMLTGMNEFKLKRLFPLATGFKVDEYRKQRLYMIVAKKIVQSPDEPLKNFFDEAGYSTLTSFVRAFRRSCYCTPGELRVDSWDFSVVPHNDEQ